MGIDDGVACKICLEREPEDTLVSDICACKGTMGVVHVECIDRWRIHFSPSDPKYSQCPDCKETLRQVEGMMPLEEPSIELSPSSFTFKIMCMSAFAFLNGSWMALTYVLVLDFTTMFPMTLLCHVTNCVVLCNSHRLLPFENDGQTKVGYTLCVLGVWVLLNVWNAWRFSIPFEVLGLVLYWLKLFFDGVPQSEYDVID